ncbi:MAG TPA: ABC transporter permease [Candidatus Cybelea sp.]|nr:ABC transporter permease [Candidatus Cybelea sp.]
MESLWRNLLYAWRNLRRSRGFTAIAVASLALGIGANTAIFSLIHAILIKTLPVSHPEQLVFVGWDVKEWPGPLLQSGFGGSMSYGAFQALRSRTDIVDGMFGYAPFGFNAENTNVKIEGRSTLLDCAVVTGDFFSTLRIRPLLGRVIGSQDDARSSPRVAVLNFDDWQRLFSGATQVSGKSITVNGTAVTIVGVAPPGFDGLEQGHHTDVWVSLGDGRGIYPFGRVPENGEAGPLDNHNWFWLVTVARLRPGITREKARAALNVTFRQFLRGNILKSATDAQLPYIEIDPAAQGSRQLARSLENPLSLLQGIVALVLLIACANVAGLLLTRAVSRRSEIGIRLALGARRRQLIGQLLVEGALIALGGAVAGIALAAWGARALLLLFTSGQSVSLDVQLSPVVLAFAALLAVLATIFFALVPAFRATGLDVNSALKGSARGTSGEGRSRLRTALVCTQVALSLLLLTDAGLFLRTLHNLESENLGFHREGLLLFGINPSELGYSDAKLVNTYGDVLNRLEAIPGVRSATASGLALISGWINNGPVSLESPPADPSAISNIYTNSVGPRFFETMGIGLILGRPVDRTDIDARRRVAVINSTMAHQIWPDANPIGRRFSYSGEFDPAEAYEVIGVAKDAKFAKVREKFHATAYVPYSQTPWKLSELFFEVRSVGEPSRLVPAVRGAVESADPDLVPFQTKTQAAEIDDSLATPRLFAHLSSVFGLLAIVLAGIGLFGLLSYLVTQRTHEIGIRLALGAQRTDILRVILRSTGWVLVIGALVGTVAALALSRVLRAYWYGIQPGDPWALAAAVVCLFAVAFIACWIPARRATRVDPLVALRHE